jgi:hypothetical protein
MTEKTAVLQSLLVWLWLFKNPGKDKDDSPYWEYIKDYTAACPMCKYCLDCTRSIFNCSPCILNKKKCCQGTTFTSPYWKWDLYGNNHKPAAARIAGTLRRYAKENGWLTPGWEKEIFK